MLVIFSICDRVKLLPYFLRHYSSLGATRFECALYMGAENPFHDQIVHYTSLYDFHIRPSITCDIDDYNGIFVAPILNTIRKEYSRQFPWYCIADLDEFGFFHGKSMPEMIKEATERGCEAVHGVFFDRIAADGYFPDIDGPLDDTFTLACDLTRVVGGCCQKVVLCRNNIEITAGHHTARARNIWRNAAEVHHFKWVKGIDKTMEDRYRRELKQKLPWAKNLPKVINILKHRINLNDQTLNVRPAARLGI